MGPASADEDTRNPSSEEASAAFSDVAFSGAAVASAGVSSPEPALDAAVSLEQAVDEPGVSPASVRPAYGLIPGPTEASIARAEAVLDGSAPDSTQGAVGAVHRPSFIFFGVVAGLSLASDIGSKVWAEMTLNQRGFEPLELIKDHLSITLAYNRGGAWGLFASASDMVRKPFFLSVSIAAIAFIISLYARLTARQKALKWGLPLVLGGALGNLNDRITRSQVIDFIDFRADWIMDANVFVHRYVPSWAMTDHWPTFNIADVAICVGVGLMAVDMFTHRPRRATTTLSGPVTPSGAPEAPAAMG